RRAGECTRNAVLHQAVAHVADQRRAVRGRHTGAVAADSRVRHADLRRAIRVNARAVAFHDAVVNGERRARAGARAEDAVAAVVAERRVAQNALRAVFRAEARGVRVNDRVPDAVEGEAGADGLDKNTGAGEEDRRLVDVELGRAVRLEEDAVARELL